VLVTDVVKQCLVGV